MKHIIFTVCLVCAGCSVPSPEVVYIQEPLQEDSERHVWMHEGYTLTSLATYSIEGRVLSTNTHRFGPAAKLAPLDFVLGWGNMADPNIYKKLNVVQSGRFYTYRPDEQSPNITYQQFFRSSSNTHIIPKNKDVLKQLKNIDVDQIVVLEGDLVKISGPNGFSWHSSLYRGDIGSGACELMWVDKVTVVSL